MNCFYKLNSNFRLGEVYKSALMDTRLVQSDILISILFLSSTLYSILSFNESISLTELNVNSQSLAAKISTSFQTRELGT